MKQKEGKKPSKSLNSSHIYLNFISMYSFLKQLFKYTHKTLHLKPDT